MLTVSHEHELEDYYANVRGHTQIRHRCTECGLWGVGPASWCASDTSHGHWLNQPDDRYVE